MLAGVADQLSRYRSHAFLLVLGELLVPGDDDRIPEKSTSTMRLVGVPNPLALKITSK